MIPAGTDSSTQSDALGGIGGPERLARIYDAAAGLWAWCGYNDLDVVGPVEHPLAEDLILLEAVSSLQAGRLTALPSTAWMRGTLASIEGRLAEHGAIRGRLLDDVMEALWGEAGS